MKLVAPVLAGLVVLLALPATGSAAVSFCGPSERPCARVTVPLDRSGATPGTVSLALERSSASHRIDPPLFVLADGPGESAIESFDSQTVDDMLGLVRRRRDVVVFDQRGTGQSDRLSCGRLDHAGEGRRPGAAARCALALGPRRAFYTLADSVQDLDAVRSELGYGQIGLLGVGYGGQLALAYASRHPGRVERLVLDSPLEPGGPNPFRLDSIQALPRAIRSLCRGRCHFTSSAARDFTRLVRRMNHRGLHGYVVNRHGHRRRAKLRSSQLLNLVLDFQELSYELPGVVKAALRGDSAPLLRLAARVDEFEALEGVSDAGGNSGLAYAAGRCQDGPLPWSTQAPLSGRLGSAFDATRSLSPFAFSPFRAGALLSGRDLRLCASWPPTPARSSTIGALPDVPALVLSGEQDLTTPVASARRIAGSLPQARLLVAPDDGHDALGEDPTGCVTEALQNFLQRRAVPRRCPRDRLASVEPPPPVSLRQLKPLAGTHGRAGRALRAVKSTLLDALESAELSPSVLRRLAEGDFRDLVDDLILRGGGLRGGSVVGRLSNGRFRLRRYEYVPGIRVSGVLAHTDSTRKLRGRLRVGGRSTPHGTLRIHGRRITGSLGGRRVHARFKLLEGEFLSSAVRRLAARLAR